jgi:hypothetical protein
MITQFANNYFQSIDTPRVRDFVATGKMGDSYVLKVGNGELFVQNKLTGEKFWTMTSNCELISRDS